MTQYNRSEKRSTIINLLLSIALIFVLLTLVYLSYKIFFTKTETSEEQTVETSVQQTEEIPEPEEKYLEFFPIIEGQQAYVGVSDRIDEKKPPTLIIYSHGSNTTVTQNMQDPFMLDLQAYGQYFTKHNYIFAASNQHGVNWGNQASIKDTLLLKEWVDQNYSIKSKIYLIGFSMGGLPTINFTTQYPELVSKVALLAPTTKVSTWNQARADKIMDIDIKIWHGNADVNVPYNYTANFVKRLKTLGKEIPLITLEGKGHFDIDTEYMEDILTFFDSK